MDGQLGFLQVSVWSDFSLEIVAERPHPAEADCCWDLSIPVRYCAWAEPWLMPLGGTQGRTGHAEPTSIPSSPSAHSLLSPQEPSTVTQLLSLQLPLGFSLEPSGRI